MFFYRTIVGNSQNAFSEAPVEARDPVYIHPEGFVLQKPHVILFTTGDELVLPGQKARPDQIYSSNSHALAAMVESLGATVSNIGIVPDTLAATKTAVRKGMKGDILLTTGGASVGDHDYVQEALKNIIDSDRPEGLTMERIIRMVGSHFKLTVDEIKSKNNSRAISFPRQVAMYLCKRLTKHSFPEIGREFGGKHHTTVMHSCEKIEQMIKDDRVFHNQVNELIEHICS